MDDIDVKIIETIEVRNFSIGRGRRRSRRSIIGTDTAGIPSIRSQVNRCLAVNLDLSPTANVKAVRCRFCTRIVKDNSDITVSRELAGRVNAGSSIGSAFIVDA